MSAAETVERSAPSPHKALLDARSAALARRGRAAAAAATRSVLLCLCGPDRFGLLLGDVAQVIPARPCTRVPGAPAALLGLTALSGRVVSVIGLADALGRGGGRSASAGRAADDLAADHASVPGHFVILRGAGDAIALAVDRVEGVVQVPMNPSPAAPFLSGPSTGLEQAGPAGLGSEAVSVYAATGSAGEAIVVIDPRRLLRRYRP